MVTTTGAFYYDDAHSGALSSIEGQYNWNIMLEKTDLNAEIQNCLPPL